MFTGLFIFPWCIALFTKSYCGIILYSEENCEDSRESSRRCFTRLPLTLTSSPTIVCLPKLKQLTLTRHDHLTSRLWSSLAFPLMSFFLFQDLIQDPTLPLVSCLLQSVTVFSLPLFFMPLIFLGSPGPVFCRLSFKMGWSALFS